jgi:hypothetical protein
MPEIAIDVGVAVLVLLLIADLITSARILARSGDIDEVDHADR